LTVITVYFNREAEVAITLNSLIQSEIENYQIIAVDDGSTDATLDELLSFDSSDKVKVVTHSNRGFTQSMIDVLSNIESKYVAICGSGDYSCPQRLKRQLQILRANEGVVLCGTASRNIDVSTGKVIDKQTYHEGELKEEDFLDS